MALKFLYKAFSHLSPPSLCNVASIVVVDVPQRANLNSTRVQYEWWSLFTANSSLYFANSSSFDFIYASTSCGATNCSDRLCLPLSMMIQRQW